MEKNMIYFKFLAVTSLFLGAFSSGHLETPLTNTTKLLAGALSSSCVILLHTEEKLKTDFTRIKDVINELARDMNVYITVTAVTFKRFSTTYLLQQHTITCNSPLFLVIHSDNGTKQELLELSFKAQSHNIFVLVFLETSIHDFFDEMYTPFDLQIFVGQIKNEEHVEFFEVYRVARNRPLRVPRLGKWTKQRGLRLPNEIMYNRRNDLEGIVLKTGSTQNEPIHYYDTILPDGKIELKGYFPAVWKELERTLNFTSEHYPSVDRVTGIPEKNGNWSGLVGMLQRHEIDVAVSDFIMDTQRSHVVDFTRPLLKSSYQLFFQKSGNNLNWDAILRPFPTPIWLVTLLWIAVGTFFLTICHIWSHKFRVEKSTRYEDFTVINSVLFFTKALCNQGHTQMPSSLSCRIIYMLAYIVAGVLVPSYSASLISYLTSKTPRRPFDSLHELLADGTYKLQTNAKTAEYTYFSEATNPLLKDIHLKLMVKIPENELPLNTREGLDKVCKDPHLAHFGDMAIASSHLVTLNEDRKCNIMYLSQPISTIYSCMALIRNSPFKSVINHFLQKFEDSGLVDSLKDKTFPIIPKNSYTNWSAVEFSDVIQIYLLLLIGMSLSVIFLIVERFTKKMSNFNRRNKFRKRKEFLKEQSKLFTLVVSDYHI